MPAVGTAQAAPRASSENCPAAESLVPGTTWHKHTLAPGVVMTNGIAKDSAGTVNMHVLRVDLTRKTLSVHPILDKIAQRSPLSTLAASHKDLVAVTNTGYFDFYTGAPTDPVVVKGSPLVISTAHQRVFGFDSAGRAEAGTVWWYASMKDGSKTHKLAGLNEPFPPTGVTLYTPKWGSARIPSHWGSVARGLVNGVVTATQQAGRGVSLPSGGSLLLANGQAASNWLSSLSTGSKLTVSSEMETQAPHPFTQAYGVGVQLIAKAGQSRTGFSCDSFRTKQPARTAIGFAKGGRTLIEAIVSEEPNTTKHGLDEDQMSRLMEQLGASQAYAFDGSGSTELLAKLHGQSSLTLQNYPADGQERPMPLGLGIGYHAPKTHKKH